MPWNITRATIGIRYSQSLQNGAGILNQRVDFHPVVTFRIERKLIIQLSLEVGPINAPEIIAMWWVLKG